MVGLAKNYHLWKHLIILVAFLLITASYAQNNGGTSGDKPASGDSKNTTNGTNSTNSTNSTNTTNTTYSDLIIPNIYYSNLTLAQRDEYMFWIKWKNGITAAPGSLSKVYSN